MTEQLPAPLTPPDCDLRSFVYMPVDIIRLFSSEFHAKANDAEWRAGFTLWLKSYHQVPAGSVPDDDVILARMAELGRDVDAWTALRPMALHGWVKCADGRLYHPVVAEKANEAWQSKIRKRAGAEHTNSVRGRRKATVTDTVTDTATHSATVSVTPSATDSAADSATASGRNERRGDETKREEQQQRARLIVEAFDAAIVDTFGPELKRPFAHGTDVVHAGRWAAMGLQPDDLYQFFAERQRARKKNNQSPIGSLAYLEQAVAERVAQQSPASAASSGAAQVRFMSPDAELRARRLAWRAARQAAEREGRQAPAGEAYGLRYDTVTQDIVLMPGSRPPIPPPPQAQTG